MASQKDFWYIASGYLNDVIDLLDDFESCPGWKIKDFAFCWRKKTFSLIYRGRQTFKELLEFSEEVALITKRFLLRPHSIKRRIGALYCLYGLYFKHPMRQFFDLRFDLQEYKETLQLVQPYRSNTENPDPAYVFRKLEVCGAIKHCATSMEMCIEFKNKERELMDIEYSKEKLANSSTIIEAAPTSQLEADHQLMLFYQNMKLKMAGNNADTEKALCLVKPELFCGVIDELADLKKKAFDELGIKESNEMSFSMDSHVKMESNNEMRNGSFSKILPQLFQDCDSASDNDTDAVNESMELANNEGENIISTVNRGKIATLSQARNEEQKIIADERVDHFMGESSSLLSMFLPKNCSKKRRKRKLNLNDLTKTELYKEPLLNADLILPVPQFNKSTRSRKRNIALQKSMQPKRKVVRKGLQYRPDGGKSIKEEVDFIGVPAVPKSATGLVLRKVDEPIMPGMLQMLVKISNSSGEEMQRKLKVKVSFKQWQEMENDPERMDRFKNKIMPLLGISRNASDDVKIKDIVAVPAEDIVKKKRSSSPSRVILDSTYMREQRVKVEDDDYNPFSDDDEILSDDLCNADYKQEKDADSFDELEDLEAVNENMSDEESSFRSTYFKERRRRKYYTYKEYYFQRDRVGVFNDELIAPKQESPANVKMVPIKVGPQTKYFPMASTRRKSPSTIRTKALNTSENNDAATDEEEFHSFNDYTTLNKPPQNPARNSTHGILKKRNPYTIMCVRAADGENIKMSAPSQNRHSRKPRVGDKQRQIAKVMSRKVPVAAGAFPQESDPVFFNDSSDDEVMKEFSVVKHEVMGSAETKMEVVSPVKSNTEISIHRSIEDLASDWDDVEEMPSIDGEYVDDSAANSLREEADSGEGSREEADPENTDIGCPVDNSITIYNPEELAIAPSLNSRHTLYAHIPNHGGNVMFPVSRVSSDKMGYHSISVGDIFRASDPLSDNIEVLKGDGAFIYSAPPFPTDDVQSLNVVTASVENQEQTSLPASENKFVLPTPEESLTPAPVIEEKIIPSYTPPCQPRPTCGFLFSSKFKTLKRLSTSGGEASGKPHPSKKLVTFFKRGSFQR